uniref:Uncharacterized protein n=1 Tax=Arundo donax TaxID=35708 RepID=A0A0A9FYL9_ARUDO
MLFKLYWKTTNLRRHKLMSKVPMMQTTNRHKKSKT